MPHLFSPLAIRGIELKNRIVVSPMCGYSAEDGFVNNWHIVNYGTRALSGAALVILEASAISPEGRITPNDLGIWKDEHIPGLTQIAEFVHSQNAIAGIQLAHAGRKASHRQPWKGGKQISSHEEGGWKPLAPSAIPWVPEEESPIALDITGIEKVKKDFRAAAERARIAGFKVLQIHGAHGYLLHEFLSPFSNKRTDEYGGSLENRIRLLLEVIDEVRSVWPEDYLLMVRISATEWTDGGWSKADSVALGSILKDKRVDIIDCSSGGNISTARIPLSPGYQVEFATAVRSTGILTGAVGLIATATQANVIITDGQADLVSLARLLIRDPYFPLRAAHELGHSVTWPVQYERAKWE